MNLREQYATQFGEDLLFMDPAETFDCCILGVVERCGEGPAVVYDAQAVVGAFIKDGMDEEEAREWFDFNVIGANLGAKTPYFLFRVEAE